MWELAENKRVTFIDYQKSSIFWERFLRYKFTKQKETSEKTKTEQIYERCGGQKAGRNFELNFSKNHKTNYKYNGEVNKVQHNEAIVVEGGVRRV